MPPQPPSDRAEIERQASLWTARLESGAMTEGDRHALAEWLEADPDHQWAFDRYCKLSAQLGEQLPVLANVDDSEALIARVAIRNRLVRWTGRTLALAAGLMLGGLAWWLMPQQVETRSAERRALTLADGSRVELNAQTRLAVNLGRHERRVRLQRGEVFFKVTSDAARPFVVQTPTGSVRVTGTAFNVRQMAAAEAEVTVLEGSVQVRAAGAEAPTSVAVREQARLASAAVVVRQLSAEEAQNAVAWRAGQVVAESALLSEVLERFAAYHGRDLVANREAAALRVGGRYSLDDLDGFLSAIEEALPVSVLRGDSGAVRVIMRPRTDR
jgi:transmembrane sensor